MSIFANLLKVTVVAAAIGGAYWWGKETGKKETAPEAKRKVTAEEVFAGFQATMRNTVDLDNLNKFRNASMTAVEFIEKLPYGFSKYSIEGQKGFYYRFGEKVAVQVIKGASFAFAVIGEDAEHYRPLFIGTDLDKLDIAISDVFEKAYEKRQAK